MLRRAFAIAVGLAALCVGDALASVAPTSCPPSRYMASPPLVIAHASGNHFGPPNTLAMMRAAVAAGADVVDADMRVTKDGVLVASHDDDVQGVTGVSRSIAHMKLAELQRLDAGTTWPGPKHDFPLRGKGVKIPTIEEMLRAFPHRRTSLEFKVVEGEKTLCGLLRRLHRTGDIYISAANDASINNFRPLCPEVTTTVTDAMVPLLQAARASGGAWCAPVPIGQPPFRFNGGPTMTAESVKWNHDHGLAVYTWTVDDPDSLDYLARIGVDGVYTARADLARRIFDRYRK